MAVFFFFLFHLFDLVIPLVLAKIKVFSFSNGIHGVASCDNFQLCLVIGHRSVELMIGLSWAGNVLCLLLEPPIRAQHLES